MTHKFNVIDVPPPTAYRFTIPAAEVAILGEVLKREVDSIRYSYEDPTKADIVDRWASIFLNCVKKEAKT